jgi:nucleoside-diphosphate-sugar epimerase
MKILVTGATGLLGSALCPVLRQAHHEVRAMVRSTSDRALVDTRGMELVRGNVLEPGSLLGAVRDVDAVVHAAAALPGRSVEALRRVIVDGTHALLDALRQHAPSARLVHISSVTAGGFGTSQHPLREDMVPRPATSYGRTRLEAEEVVREHGRRGPATILRMCTLYGPRDRLLPPLYRSIAFGLTPLPDAGDMELSLLHADDAARAVARLLETPEPLDPVYYVADDRPVSWKRMCGVIQATLRRSVSVPVVIGRGLLVRAEALLELSSRLPRRLERRIPDALCPDTIRLLLGRGLVCDGTALRERTGWVPQNDLSRGMRRTLAWFRDHDLV